MHQIKVVNQSKETIIDRFDGLAYSFAPGEKGINIALDAAQHIFGVDFPMNAEECASEPFRAAIFEHLGKRWGWNYMNADRASVAKATFAKFSFVPVELKTVELVQKTDDLPLPRGDKTDIAQPEDEISEVEEIVEAPKKQKK